MPFFQSEPFDTAQATYIWTGLGTPGFFSVHVKGHAQKFTSGIELVRDTAFVGGLAIDVMGWTGPLTKGTEPYTVSGNFKGSYSKEPFAPRLDFIGKSHLSKKLRIASSTRRSTVSWVSPSALSRA